jgi:hypothetical protein
MKKNNSAKNYAHYWFMVMTLGVALGFTMQTVRAWVEPSSNPPLSNLGAPVNTGSVPQTKSGPLGVNMSIQASPGWGLQVGGSAKIENTLVADGFHNYYGALINGGKACTAGTCASPIGLVVGYGNVGIGTNSPTAKLDVQGGAEINGQARVYGDIKLYNPGAGKDTMILRNDNALSTVADIRFMKNGGIAAQGNLYLFIDSNNGGDNNFIVKRNTDDYNGGANILRITENAS